MFVVSQILERVARVTRRAVAAACVAGALLAMCEGLGRAACPSPPYAAQCWYPCDEPTGGPIRILYLGSATVPPWLPAGLGATAFGSAVDCNGCPLASGVDYVATAITWATARSWPPESFRAFDVLVTDRNSGAAFTAPSASDPWLPVYTTARRAVLTGMHVDDAYHLGTHNALAEFVQNVVTWLAEDECCQMPRGQGVIPAVFVAKDQSSMAMRYTPWRGVRRSYAMGQDSDFSCALQARHDDTVFIGSHPIFRSLNDGACGTCGANTACSVDNAAQVVHSVWMPQHHPCGYEDDGFVAVQRVEVIAPVLLPSLPPAMPCSADGHPLISCIADASAATTATIVLERPCCGEIEPVPRIPGPGCP